MIPRKAVLIDHPSFSADAWNNLHPLAFSRHRHLFELIRAMGWSDADAVRLAALPDRGTLLRFHDAAYVDALREAVERGVVGVEARTRFHFGTMENPVFPGLFARAAATVGGSIAAAEAALAGLLAFHPAGGTHHGRRDRASGFCYFNDPAFAIDRLLAGGAAPVLYVDLDAHHGDGVEALFAEHPQVVTLSIHEEGRWPHSGGPDDAAPGNAVNIAVPRGLNDSELDWLIQGPAAALIERLVPRAVVVTAGADCLKGDPLSAMALSNRAFWRAVSVLVERVPHAVVLGGGGYNPWTVTRGWAGLWAVLSGRDVTAPLTPEAAALLVGLESDLIDADEVDPQWLAAMADRPNDGPVRAAVKARGEAALARLRMPV